MENQNGVRAVSTHFSFLAHSSTFIWIILPQLFYSNTRMLAKSFYPIFWLASMVSPPPEFFPLDLFIRTGFSLPRSGSAIDCHRGHHWNRIPVVHWAARVVGDIHITLGRVRVRVRVISLRRHFYILWGKWCKPKNIWNFWFFKIARTKEACKIWSSDFVRFPTENWRTMKVAQDKSCTVWLTVYSLELNEDNFFWFW